MTTDVPSRLLDLPDDPEKLKALVILLQETRASEADRLRAAVQARQDLALQLGSCREKLDQVTRQIEVSQDPERSGVLRTVDLVTQAVTSPRRRRLSENVLASVLLRLARKAARSDEYARAQTLYEVIALFKPRPFLLKQIGTMLYHQQHYRSALEVLTPVQKWLQGDQDVNFLIEASERVLQDAKGGSG